MKDSKSNNEQNLDMYITFSILTDKIMAGEIRDERSFNQILDSFCDNEIERNNFKKVFIDNLVCLLSKAQADSRKNKSSFPLVTTMLGYLETNYIQDIHSGDSSKNLCAIINKWLEYSSSFYQGQ
ncbi:MAG: hypothetical protein CBC29_05345 [Methylococcaceae bacterium TMED69]|nr:MAG: hypothetical protein CBC29_05345 [Methylococcaceae bacterium TMED69]